jgi:hypothetical protein
MKGLGEEWDRRNYEAVSDGNKKANRREDKYFLRQLALIDFN